MTNRKRIRSNRKTRRFRRRLGAELLERRDLLAADTPMLVADINLQELGLDPVQLVDVNGTLFFSADDAVNGRELWKSDGTLTGTVMVKDINPGSDSSRPFNLTNVNGTLFFTADDGANGGELWKSDGTAAGTVLVQDIVPGPSGSMGTASNTSPVITNVNGTAFFRASQYGITGRELWKSDGTPEGTSLVKDILPGPGDSVMQQLTSANGSLFFTATDGTNSGLTKQLWKSDGTTAGTVRIAFADGGFGSLTDVNGTLFVTADNSGSGEELWKSDGTEAGTMMVKDIGSGGNSSFPGNLTNVDGTLFFRAEGSAGTGLWKSDGTEAGTILVKSLPIYGGRGPGWLTNVGGTLFFSTNALSKGRELWKSDGTETGTVLVKDIRPGGSGSGPSFLTNANGTLFFRANDGSNGNELWKSDGTEAGTTLVIDINTGSSGSHPSNSSKFANVGGTLFFTANNGVRDQLWKSDGTEAGSVVLVDKSIANDSSSIGFIEDVNGTAFFVADDGVNGRELWMSDETFADTALLKDILPGPDSSQPQQLTNVDGTLFFTADDGVNGRELWKSDGTAAGTVLVKDILPGASSSRPRGLRDVNGTLFFSANDGVNGFELWKSDGTAAGTSLVKDVRPGSSSGASVVTNVNGTLFFGANDGINGLELWKSDGTAAGTVLVKDIRPGGSGSSPSFLTNVNGTLFFTADDGLNGRELWKSDGTAVGTVLVKDVRPGTGGSDPRSMIAAADRLFFFAYDAVNGTELWKSDGTSAGTVLVSDINPGINGSYPGEFEFNPNITYLNSEVFFTANDGTNGIELWTSNGKSNGTKLVKDINPGLADAFIDRITNVNGELFFAAEDGVSGRELWKTDGTTAGTALVADLRPGRFGSNPYRLTDVNGTLVFAAYDRLLGHELWRLLDSNDAAFHPEVVLPAGSGTILVERNNNDVVVSKNSTEVFRSSLSSILDVTLTGDRESETFTVNIDGLTPLQLPGGIIIDAGKGPSDVDTLELIGSTTVSNYDYTTGGPESGTITLDGFTVIFSEFEPILDQLNVVNRKFAIGTTGSQTIVLGAGDPGYSTIDDDGTAAFEGITFKSPSSTNVLTISAGDGDDSITVEELDPFFDALLTVQGDTGDDTIDASQSNDPVVISGGAGADTLLGGSAADTIAGGDGNDNIDGGGGSDSVDGGGGVNDVAVDVEDGKATIAEETVFELSAVFENLQSASIDWGDDTVEPAAVNGDTATGSHTYALAGDYTVTISAVTPDGAKTETLAVNVTTLIAVDGEVIVRRGIARVGGTAGQDDIEIGRTTDGANLQVKINGVVVHDATPISQLNEIRAWGHEGDDRVALIDLTLASMLDGGAGDDRLDGGGGADLMFGGAGNDHLSGGGGNDFLIGGLGADRIIGGAGHDILVSNDFDPLLSLEALRKILEDWADGKDVDSAADELETDESDLAGVDRLTGGSGSDWFIVDLLDEITDRNKTAKDGDKVTTI